MSVQFLYVRVLLLAGFFFSQAVVDLHAATETHDHHDTGCEMCLVATQAWDVPAAASRAVGMSNFVQIRGLYGEPAISCTTFTSETLSRGPPTAS